MSLSSLSPLTTLLPPGVSLLEGLELFFQVVQDTFTTNLVAGIGLAAVLLGGRSRIVRKMFIVPDPAAGPKQRASERLLVIQSPLHPRNHGAVYPLQRTRLMHSAHPHEMLVDLMDERGHYSVGLQRAAVAGQTLPPWEARKAMYKVWYGEKEGLAKFMESTKVQEAQ